MGPRLYERSLDLLEMTNKVFENGWVFTSNGDFGKASLVVSGNVIRHLVEEDGDLPADVGTEADRVDLAGAYVLPGFVDTHIHLTALALNKLRCDLSKASSARDACEMLAQWAAAHPDAPFLVGVDFDESRWDRESLPTRVMLDGVDDRRPVLARRICGHIGVVNTPLLQRLGRWPDLVDENAGFVREQALWAAGRFWEPNTEEVVAGFHAAIKDLHRLGITTIHDIVEPHNFDAYVRGVSGSAAPLRIDALVHANPRHLEYYRRQCQESRARDFRVVGIKCFLDGSLGGRTAALNADYNDGPGWGTLLMRDHVTRALADECFENGYVLAIHAIGDRAIDEAAAVLRDFPKGTHLFRMEHCEVAGRAQIDHLKSAPVFLSLQPNFIRNWGGPGGLNERRLGKERNRWCNPYRSLLEAGLTCVFGSDGMPPGPLYGLQGATRHPVPEECLTPREAIACYTSRPHAVAAHQRNAGVLEPGRLADLVVVDHNPLTEDFDTVQVVKTVVDGEVVFDTPAVE
jgi:hypothetical protein